LKVVVVGGGMAGMFTSYYLVKDGHSVLVIDKNVDQDRTSIYNAGFITPSFPASGIPMRRLLAAAIRPQGPLYFSLVEILRNLGWFEAGLRTGLSGFEEVLHTLGKKSLSLYEQFFSEENVEVDLAKGVLALFAHEGPAKEVADVVRGKFVEPKEVEEMGYIGFGGGALLDEYFVNPLKLYSELRRRLVELGVRFRLGEEARVKMNGKRAAGALIGTEFIDSDAVVITAGARSRAVCRELGYDPRILPARGLAIICETGGNKLVEHAAFFEDLGISLGQHNQNTFRMTSYFELVGFKQDFDPSRKKYLIDSVREHVKGSDKLKIAQEGVGFRPCAPDQLPVVGRVPGVENAWVASGNCREGVILAPVTGIMISKMISGQPPTDLPISSIDPGRFAK
jgi:D-amino-acid dehydrogenase